MSQCVIYAEGYKYQLRAGYAVLLPELADGSRAPISTDWLELDPDGTLRIRAGYASDGPSGPTIDTKNAMRGAFIHDAGYQLMRLGHLPHSLRPVWDGILRRVIKEDGMWSVRANAWYLMVRIFADSAADPAGEAPDVMAGCGCPSPNSPEPAAAQEELQRAGS